MTLFIHARRLIDGTGAAPIEDAALVVSGNRIVAVGQRADLDPPRDARLIALPDHTLAPGLIDVHSHATIDTAGNEHAQVARPEGEVALWAAHLLGRDLRAGVTTIRTLGDRKFIDITLRRMQTDGLVWAPRMQVAGHLIQSSLVNVSISEATADDPYLLRRYVRETVRAGADWVKFYATPNSSWPDPTAAIYSRTEVDCIFDEARRLGKPVSVHCHGGVAADWCIEHGVDSLEHGLYLEAAQFQAMAQHGIPLIPTTSVVLVKPDVGASPRLVETKERARSFLRIARRYGVRCIPGTDAVHGALASTSDAARLLRIESDLGTLAVGKIADVVAFRGDLTSDPAALRQVDLVMQGGRLAVMTDSAEGQAWTAYAAGGTGWIRDLRPT
jgi:imidazolonepropionase-like amidohydrolase